MTTYKKWSEIRRSGNASMQRGFHSAATASVWLAELRRHAGLTQSQLAERLGVTQGWISQIENETDIRISTISAYVAALGGTLQFRAVLPDNMVVNLDEMPATETADTCVADAV